MGEIRKMQTEHKTWLHYNFPGQLPHQPLLGIVEEVGELSHVFLKCEQGIRSGLSPKQAADKERDAVGDIFIYLMSYCNTNKIDLERTVQETWERVKQRDWRLYPELGNANPRP